MTDRPSAADMVAAAGTVADVGRELLRVNRALAIPVDELQWRFTGSGGPGGQHANTANTKVEVRFDIDASPTLTAAQRARLRDCFGPTLRIVSAEGRSQARNRDLALRRLCDRLASALRVARPRRPTRPSASSVQRRLTDKAQRSARKRDRASNRRASDD